MLTGSQADRDALFAQIGKRGAKSAVDLVLLTHGMDKHLWLTSGSISDQDIRAAGPFPRLRMVYMMACYSASLEGAWRDTGAQVVVGHQDVNSLLVVLPFSYFLCWWADGLVPAVPHKKACIGLTPPIRRLPPAQSSGS